MKKWIVIAIVVLVVLGAILGNEKEIDPQIGKENTQETFAEEIYEETNEAEVEEKLKFTLVAGEKGDYGELLSVNVGTEFEENYYVYRIPTGTYKVTNIGEYINQFNIYSDEMHITEYGWEEPAEVFCVELLKVNESAIISFEDGQYIEIHEPAEFLLEMQ